MRDKISLWIAQHLPRRLVYWCAVRVGSHGASNPPSTVVPEMTMMDALQRWERRRDT
jgi:hypothetical protein